MHFFVFILVYPIIWLLSILPMRVLYVISDFFYLIIYHIIGYRKKDIYTNLKLSFPNKTENEIKLIQKKFYSHFIDIFVEMIKSFTISEKELKQRYQFTNLELIANLEKEKKSLILMGSHYANWEWIFILNKYVVDYQGIAVYKRIVNKFFDQKIRLSRSRFGTKLIATKKTIELMKANNKNGILALYGFLNDQSPKLSKTKYWSDFMGVNVPVQTGSEFLAKQHNLSVLMFKTKKIKRGYYTSEIILLAKNPNDFKDYEITDLFIKNLEEQIKAKPEHYFWSHKRFKHRNNKPGFDIILNCSNNSENK